MTIYNTLTRRKETFTPLTPGEIKMYSCGQTVYNDIHVGNARFYVVFDVIRRYMTHKGYRVCFVQNFTDVDDKIIQKAAEEKCPAQEIAERYIRHTLADLQALNVMPATFAPRATQEMPEIIALAQTLQDKGFAYEKNGSLFFHTEKAADYGKLSRKHPKELAAGARVEVNPEKKHPADFVLWKPAKPGEPYWESPWGNGRPGWHIECSAMAKKYLGDRIDIHGGAADLIFPHHENEIAQSEAANGTPFTNYWMHLGLLTVNQKKMAKSEGNFFTLREVAAAFPYDAIRFYLLNGHYRAPMEYGPHLLSAAQTALTRIKNATDRLAHYAQGEAPAPTAAAQAEAPAPAALAPAEAALTMQADAFAADFEAAMDDDFNTADAVAALFELIKFANTYADRPSPALARHLLAIIRRLCGILGLALDADIRAKEPIILSEQARVQRQHGLPAAEIEALLAERQRFRQAENWAAADGVRDALLEKGVEIKDTPDGTRWNYR